MSRRLPAAATTIEILKPGPQATIQDLGRPGLADLGVGASGAADSASHRLANTTVGNPETSATIEVTLGGLVARFSAATLISVTGATCRIRLGDRDVSMAELVEVGAGEVLRLGPPRSGLRSYVAVRGGVVVAPVLGSRSTDTFADIGPPALTAGMRLPVGDETAGEPVTSTTAEIEAAASPVLRVIPGPRDDWFVAGAVETLCSAEYRVSPASNRVGLRLQGPSLRRSETSELPPEPLVTGALQVPPTGQPILFLADHPTTGGYPVIAVVVEEDVRLAAQSRPGHHLRFRVAV